MIIEEALRAYLCSVTGVTDLVSDRIQCGEFVPEGSALPDVYYEVSHDGYQDTFDGLGENLQFPIVEITCRALKAIDASRICSAVVNALRDAPGVNVTVGATTAAPFAEIDVDDPGSHVPNGELVSAAGTQQSIYRYAALLTIGFDSAA